MIVLINGHGIDGYLDTLYSPNQDFFESSIAPGSFEQDDDGGNVSADEATLADSVYSTILSSTATLNSAFLSGSGLAPLSSLIRSSPPGSKTATSPPLPLNIFPKSSHSKSGSGSSWSMPHPSSPTFDRHCLEGEELHLLPSRIIRAFIATKVSASDSLL